MTEGRGFGNAADGRARAAGAGTSRFARAVEALKGGAAVVLADEARAAAAHLVVAADRATPRALEALDRRGRGPALAPAGGPALAPAGGPALALAGMAVEAVPVRTGGVLGHPDAVEAAADLGRAGGLPVAMRALDLPGGLLAREGEAARLAARLGLALVSVQDVVAARLATEAVVEEVASARLPTIHAAETLRVHAFRSLVDGSEHLALVQRPPGGFGAAPLVRLHSECLTGDALGSLRCDCGDQLRTALARVSDDAQGGAVLYLRGQEGRGIGLANKIRAYALQDRGLDTVDANTELGFPADARDYAVAVGILRRLGIARLRLLSNNPAKGAALERYGVAVAERHGLRIGPNPHNASYLETKRLRMGHDLPGGASGVSGSPNAPPQEPP